MTTFLALLHSSGIAAEPPMKLKDLHGSAPMEHPEQVRVLYQWMPDPSMMLTSLPHLGLSTISCLEGDLHTSVRWVVAHRKRLTSLPHVCTPDNFFLLLCSALF